MIKTIQNPESELYMELSTKLKLLRKKHAMTQEKLAEAINVERSSVGKYETGTMPSMDVLQRIASVFDVSVDYLLGRDESSNIFDIKNILKLSTKKVPLLGKIACGKPIYADEERGEYVLTSDGIDADFCLRAQGDSMIGARILDGDIVFVKQQPSVENGQIAAVLIGDEATLKRVYYYPDKNKLVLNPENPAFEPLVYVGEELNEVRILGHAIAFQSTVK